MASAIRHARGSGYLILAVVKEKRKPRRTFFKAVRLSAGELDFVERAGRSGSTTYQRLARLRDRRTNAGLIKKVDCCSEPRA